MLFGTRWNTPENGRSPGAILDVSSGSHLFSGDAKLNRSKLADLSEILSSIAIVITLVYLSIEITQNTEAIEGQTRQSVLNAAQEELAILLDNPDLTQGLAGTKSLDEVQSTRLDSFLTMALRSREFSWLQYQNGTIDRNQWATEEAVLISILDSDVARLWWNRLGRHAFGAEFVGYVDNLVRDVPATNKLWQLSLSWSTEEEDAE